MINTDKFGLQLKFSVVNGKHEILRDETTFHVFPLLSTTFHVWGNHENFYLQNPEFGKLESRTSSDNAWNSESKQLDFRVCSRIETLNRGLFISC